MAIPESKKLILFFLLLAFLRTGVAQMPYDTTQVDSILEHAMQISRNHPDSGLQIAYQYLELAHKASDPAREAQANLAIAVGKMYQGALREMPEYLLSAEKLYLEAEVKTELPRLYAYFGTYYKRQGLYPEALEYQVKALNIRQEMNAPPRSIGASYNNIGNLYRDLNQFERALEYLRQARAVFEELQEGYALATITSNIGLTFSQQEQLDSALFYYEDALAIYERLGDLREKGRMSFLLGELYHKRNYLERAEMFLQNSIQAFSEVEDQYMLGLAYNRLGQVYAGTNRYDVAINAYQRSIELAQITGSLTDEGATSKLLAEAHYHSGDFELAYDHMLRYASLYDSLINQDFNQKLAEQKTKFESAQQLEAIEELEARELTQKQLRKWLIIGIGALFLFGLFAAWAAAIRTRDLRRMKEQKEAIGNLLSEKEKLLQDLTKTQNKLIASEKMASLGQLTAGIAHEINNPINYIKSSVEALKLDFNDLSKLLEKVIALNEDNAPEQAKELIQLNASLDAPLLAEEMSELISSIERGALRTHEIVKNLRLFPGVPASNSWKPISMKD